MLISPTVITYLLLGRMLDVKALRTEIKTLKQDDFTKLDELWMKNLDNWLSGKSKPRKSTFDEFKDYFQQLAQRDGVAMPRPFSDFDHDELFVPEGNVNPKDKWLIIKSEYEEALEYFGLSDHFVARELRSVLWILKRATDRALDHVNMSTLEEELMNDAILSSDGMLNGLLVTIHIPYNDPNHGPKILDSTFSLNLVLYLQACLDTETESVMSVFFNRFLESPELDKPSFHHYVEVLKILMKKRDKGNVTYNDVCEELDISEDKTLRRYRRGESPLPKEVISSILKISGELYHCVTFWVNMVKILTENGADLANINRELKRYPDYVTIAYRRRNERPL